MKRLSLFVAIGISLLVSAVLVGPTSAAPKFEGQNASQNCSTDIPGLGSLEDAFFGGNHGQCVSQVELGHNAENGANTIVVYLCTDPNNAELLEELGFRNQGECVKYFRANPEDLPF